MMKGLVFTRIMLPESDEVLHPPDYSGRAGQDNYNLNTLLLISMGVVGRPNRSEVG